MFRAQALSPGFLAQVLGAAATGSRNYLAVVVNRDTSLLIGFTALDG